MSSIGLQLKPYLLLDRTNLNSGREEAEHRVVYDLLCEELDWLEILLYYVDSPGSWEMSLTYQNNILCLKNPFPLLFHPTTPLVRHINNNLLVDADMCICPFIEAYTELWAWIEPFFVKLWALRNS